MRKGISVIGVPMWLGQTRFGANLGPDAMRAAGLVTRLKGLAYRVSDEGISRSVRKRPTSVRTKC
ncbi:hypothetical protein [Thermosinus carboxydivorans]|nr:hypothetical protein [Thermosinus carboxydivorans]